MFEIKALRVHIEIRHKQEHIFREFERETLRVSQQGRPDAEFAMIGLDTDETEVGAQAKNAMLQTPGKTHHPFVRAPITYQQDMFLPKPILESSASGGRAHLITLPQRNPDQPFRNMWNVSLYHRTNNKLMHGGILMQ